MHDGTCRNPRIGEIEARESEVQGHLQSHTQFKTDLGYIKPSLMKEQRVGKKKKTRKEESQLSRFCIFDSFLSQRRVSFQLH